jgi:hypothetical protein
VAIAGLPVTNEPQRTAPVGPSKDLMAPNSAQLNLDLTPAIARSRSPRRMWSSIAYGVLLFVLFFTGLLRVLRPSNPRGDLVIGGMPQKAVVFSSQPAIALGSDKRDARNEDEGG